MTKNDTFDHMLMKACKDNLKTTIDPDHYASITLDQLFDGMTYGDYYFEIPKHDTWSGLPVVVSLTEKG